MSYQGNPCWYELSTAKGQLAAAGDFYGKILGWNISDSGMLGFAYHLAKSGDEMVAGLLEIPDDMAGAPPMWLIYFAVDDLDKSITDATAAGATVHRPATEVPGTGRFAILADPQGAGFGFLEPDMSQMSDADRAKAETSGAFDQSKAGHGNWHELMTTDTEAGFQFYSRLLGWTKGETMPMDECPDGGEGPGGVYQLVKHKGTDIGAMTGLGHAPQPVWLPYFGVEKPVTEAIEAIKAAGGHVEAGPIEVPGPAYIAIGSDPQGAWFAIVGQKK